MDLHTLAELAPTRRTVNSSYAIGRAALALIESIAKAHGVALRELYSVRKTRRLVHARQEVFWALYQTRRYSLPVIGEHFGRDHTTVLHGVRAHSARLAAQTARDAA